MPKLLKWALIAAGGFVGVCVLLIVVASIFAPEEFEAEQQKREQVAEGDAPGEVQDSESQEESEPVNFTIADEYDHSIPGQRTRVTRSIVAPEAQTFEQRGDVVAEAARQLQGEKGVDVASVFLIASDKLVGEGAIATAVYSPDGGGLAGDESDQVWKVESSGEEITGQQIQISELWAEAAKAAVDAGTDLDEDAVSQEIATELGITPEEVFPLFYQLKPYEVTD